MKSFFLVGFFGLMLMVYPSFGQAGDDQADDFYKIGKEKYEAGKYQEGADNFRNAFDTYLKEGNILGEVKSLNLLGECFANLNQCDAALKALNQSLELTKVNFKSISLEVADAYYYLARAQGGCARNYETAIPNMHRSIFIKRKLVGEKPELALNYSFIGYMFLSQGKYDSAGYYLNRAFSIQQKFLAADDQELANTLFLLGRLAENKSELTTALDFLQQSLAIRIGKLHAAHPNISNSLQQLGSVYQKIGNTDRALEYYKKGLAIRIQSLGANHANVAASYYAIGNLYGNVFNYAQAIDYTRQGNAIMRNIYGDKSDILPTYEAYLAKMYGKINNHASALAAFTTAQRSAEKNLKPDHLYLGIVYNIIGEYYADQNETARANEYLLKALVIFRKGGSSNAVREADVLAKLGAIQEKSGDITATIKNYNHALALYQSKMGDKNPKVATIFQLMADAQVNQKKFESGLKYYQKSFAALAPDFADTLGLSNPMLMNLENKSLAVRIAGKKALALQMWHKQTAKQQHLQVSLETDLFAITLAQELSRDYEFESSKADLNQELEALFHRAVESAYQLHLTTGDQRYLETAFALSEKSKATLLLENARDESAKLLAGVPDSLIRQERDTEIAWAFHRNQLYRAQLVKDTAALSKQEQLIFKLQEKYADMRSDLEKNFPAYYRIKHAAVEPVLASTQAQLATDVCLLEFFTTPQSVFRFTITQSQIKLDKLKKDSAFTTLLNNYQNSLTDANFIVNQPQAADALYTTSAHELYNALLKSALEKQAIARIIIVPDDQLAQLNFGTLLIQPVKSSKPDYKNLEYVTKQWRISYAYSASWLQQNQSANKTYVKKFGGFAPAYSGNAFTPVDSTKHPLTYLAMRSGNLALPGAVKEIESIQSIMTGDVWTNEHATETNFKQNAGQYHVLHLAMHTLINNENPQYSELLFHAANDTQSDGLLTVAEIYNMKLNAAMVVLSACSSGAGKLQAGEGPISLSRAFSYAGSPSVVMSYWKVPDDATSTIMQNFYTELLNGTAKDEALRKAQLKFLNETTDPVYQHPYFWSGLVLTGSVTPIASSWYSNVGVVITWVVLAIIGIYFIIRMKREWAIKDE
jgi:CHAT domain-containing protein